MKDQTLRGIYLLFLLILAISGGVSFMALRTINRDRVSSDWVNQTHGTIYELNSILGGLQSGEGQLRAYALTRDDRDLAEARASFEDAREHLVVTKALMRKDADFNRTLDQLDATLQARLDFSTQLEQAVAAGSSERAAALLREDPAGGKVREFERSVTRLRSRQFELLGARDHESYLRAQSTRWVVGLGIGLNFVLLLAVAGLIRATLAARRRLAETLQQANAVLEQKVQERTAELVASNRRLTAENISRRWTGASQEHQLRYNEAIIGTVSDAVLVLSKALNIGRVNPAVMRATGRGEEALLGKPVTDFLRVAGAAGAPDPLARAMQDGRELVDQAGELLVAAGAARPCRFTLVPLRDNNKVVGSVLVVRLTPDS